MSRDFPLNSFRSLFDRLTIELFNHTEELYGATSIAMPQTRSKIATMIMKSCTSLNRSMEALISGDESNRKECPSKERAWGNLMEIQRFPKATASTK
jgi:hypothetical protein